MKQRLAITVRGRQHSWTFHFDDDPKHIEEWREDGLDVVQIENSIPRWVVDAGLIRPWVFFQDIFKFRNPFRK